MKAVLTELICNLDTGVGVCEVESLCLIEYNDTLANWLAVSDEQVYLSNHFSDEIIKRINKAH